MKSVFCEWDNLRLRRRSVGGVVGVVLLLPHGDGNYFFIDKHREISCWKLNFLNEPSCPPVGRSVGRTLGLL